MFYLHSTMYLFQPGLNVEHLIADRFTFHYVSISTAIMFDISTFSCSFTFHYVSISTLSISLPFSVIIHLHSTMYLFQPIFVRDLIYKIMIFTFHYVSISTPESWHCRLRLLDLHSTMYLFQPKSALLRIFIINIYIPLCIYFNPRSSEALYLLE